MSTRKITAVAAGILLKTDGSFLLASRPAGKAYAHYWEFPGGKLEQGETALEALTRELQEEMGIEVTQATPWLAQTFDYPHALVHLQFFRVTQWCGDIQSREGQSFAWQKLGQIQVSPILPANGPILRGLALPGCMAFSNVAELGHSAFLDRLEYRLKQGPFWLVLREPQLSTSEYRHLALDIQPRLRQSGSKLIVHHQIDMAQEIGADGVHLPARALYQLSQRPEGLDWVGASVHNSAELRIAQTLRLDYAVLGHVAATQSHPDSPALGWQGFADVVSQGWSLPVYAIGGMTMQDQTIAQQYGGHGVACLRAFWNTK